MITSTELAERMKADICELQETGVVPRSCSSFSELHDYFDANTCGGAEDIHDEWFQDVPSTNEAMYEAIMSFNDYFNEAADIVNDWLAARSQQA